MYTIGFKYKSNWALVMIGKITYKSTSGKRVMEFDFFTAYIFLAVAWGRATVPLSTLAKRHLSTQGEVVLQVLRNSPDMGEQRAQALTFFTFTS